MSRLFPPSAAVCLAAAALIAAAGCNQPTSSYNAPDPQPPELLQPPPADTQIGAEFIVHPEYRLQLHDVLEIIYHVKHRPTQEGYRLKIEDVVSVEFPFQPQLNQVRKLQSDGNIRLLLVGDVPALDRTTTEIETDLRGRYARYMKDPELTVTVEKSNIKIEELKKAITTAPRGQSRLMPVKPDGTVDLPFIGTAQAYGKTVAELRADLNRMYAENNLQEIEVTVQVNHVAPQKVFVFGEVGSPRQIETVGPITLLQAIAAAGGFTTRAQLDKVLLVRRRGVPVPEGVLVDCQSLLTAQRATPQGTVPDFRQFRHDIWMQDYDVVFVPTHGLAKFDDWVDQVFTKGIRAILPYSFNMGLSFSYELRNAPSTFKNKTNGGPPNINVNVAP